MDLIIEHVACDICGAIKGQPCIPDDGQNIEDIGRCHGMRMDDFMEFAPFEARLQEHLDMMKDARECESPEVCDAMNEHALMFTAEEYFEHTGREWPDPEEV